MPINDAVSPIINAFLAGRDQKLQEERAVRDKQAADDESKIRQLNAKRIQQELSAFDARQTAERQNTFLNRSNEITRGILSGALQTEQIDKISAALNGQTPNIPGAIGLVTQPKTVVNLPGEQVEAPSLADLRKVSADNYAAAEAAKFQALQATEKMKTGEKLIVEKAKSEFKAGESAKARTHQETLAANRAIAEKALAEYNAKQRLRGIEMQQAGANSRTAAAIAARKVEDIGDVENLLETNVIPGFMTRQGIAALGKDRATLLNKLAAERKVKVFSDQQYKEIQGISKLTGILKKIENFNRQLGNGDPSATLPLTSMNDKYNELKGELGTVAREFGGERGALSDEDIERMVELISVRVGLDVAGTNDRRLEELKQRQLRIFNHYYPSGTNQIQRLKAARQLGIDPKLLADKEKK